MENIFFESWESIGRTFIITILAYITMIGMLRVSGKRTLSKMNAFDFVVTIGLGSSIATVALNKSVPLADGALVFFLLIFLQFTITWLSVRIGKLKGIVTSQPTLILYKGEIFTDILKKERITIEELNVAARKKGCGQFKNIDAIVLETTGDITVIPTLTTTDAETMKTVKGYP
jgi:uncharacterized membrane protein YcaP (DUF421 family)